MDFIAFTDKELYELYLDIVQLKETFCLPKNSKLRKLTEQIMIAGGSSSLAMEMIGYNIAMEICKRHYVENGDA